MIEYGNDYPQDAYGEYAGITWKPVDLGPYLSGQAVRPEPTVGLCRKDGLQMLYPGKEHTVIGEMESGKSWFALGCVMAELTLGSCVLYVHFEESDPTDTIERLQLLGVPGDTILERFTFVGPNEPVDKYALDALLDPAPSLVILDGINEAMSMHNQAIRDEDGVAAFRRKLVKPCTAVGAAVLGCDHVVKDQEKRGRGPLGSIHKGNGLTGSLILLENASPFGRGQRGASHVFVTKDRPGYLRRRGRSGKLPGKTYMGTLVVDDTRMWVLNGVDLSFFEPPDDATPTDTAKTRDQQDDDSVYDVVAAIIKDGKRPSLRMVRAKASINAARVGDALTRLVYDHRLDEQGGPNRSRLFSIPVGGSTGGSDETA